MRFKYYLRGFGTGVLLATILLIIAINIKDNMPADNSKGQEETGSSNIMKATSQEEKEQNLNSDSNLNDSQDNTAAISETEGSGGDSSQNLATAETTVAESNTTEVESPENNVPSEAQSEAVQPETTQEPPEQPMIEPSGVGGQNTEIEVTISPGMSSEDAARVLAELGIVDDEAAFDNYMENNGYASRLRIGVYQIAKGAPYEEVARAITR